MDNESDRPFAIFRAGRRRGPPTSVTEAEYAAGATGMLASAEATPSYSTRVYAWGGRRGGHTRGMSGENPVLAARPREDDPAPYRF